MNQVHKENLTHVENAIGGRQGLDIEIFGMEGVPAEIIDQHNQQVTQKHFAEEAERARLTGNPVRGLYANGQAPPNKRKKVNESLEEIEERANKFRHDRQNGILPAPPVEVTQPNPVRNFPSRLRIKQLTISIDAPSSCTVRRTTCPLLWGTHIPTASPASPAFPHKWCHPSPFRYCPRATRCPSPTTRLRRTPSCLCSERLGPHDNTSIRRRPHRLRRKRGNSRRQKGGEEEQKERQY